MGTAPYYGPNRRGWTRLSTAAQSEFDRLVERVGLQPAAERLGIGVPLVERLQYGGSATADAVGRVEAALRKERLA